MDIGVVVPTQGPYAEPAIFTRLVRRAESLGYGHAWFGDHVVVPHETAELSRREWLEAVTCAAVGAGLTTRLRFGFDVLVLPYRPPVQLAKQLATVDLLSGGRVTVAVGIGFLRREFEALGAPPYEERAAVTEEHVAVLRDLWSGDGPSSFEGRYTDYREIDAFPKPAGPIPILLGGNHRRALERAAALGDGWHPLWPSPDGYRAARAFITRRRAELGRTGPFTFSYSCPETRVTDGGPAPVRHVPYGGAAVPPEFSYVPPPPTAGDGRRLLQGDPDQLRSDLAGLAEVGVEQLVLRFWGGAPDITPERFEEAMARFAAEVLGWEPEERSVPDPPTGNLSNI